MFQPSSTRNRPMVMTADVRTAQDPYGAQTSRPAVSNTHPSAFAASNTPQQQHQKVSAPRELNNTSDHDKNKKGRKRAALASNATQMPPTQRRRLNTSDSGPSGTVASAGNPNDDDLEQVSLISRAKHPDNYMAVKALQFAPYKRPGLAAPSKASQGGQKLGWDSETNSDIDDEDDEDDWDVFEHSARMMHFLEEESEEDEDIYLL